MARGEQIGAYALTGWLIEGTQNDCSRAVDGAWLGHEPKRPASTLHVHAGADLVCLVYPAREVLVELVQAGDPELMHE